MTNITEKIFHTELCGICIQDFNKIGNDCLLLKCGHIFHNHCFKIWAECHSICPTCKEKAIVPLSREEILERGKNNFICTTQRVLFILAYIVVGIYDGIFPSEEELWERGILPRDTRSFIHSDNHWQYGLAGMLISPFVAGAYTMIQGRLIKPNAVRINYRPPKTAT